MRTVRIWSIACPDRSGRPHSDLGEARRFVLISGNYNGAPFVDTYASAIENVGQVNVRIAVLPARAAYLVRAGSIKGLTAAVREASTRWAGTTELIVPVDAGGHVATGYAQLLEFAEIDGFVNVDVADRTARTIGRRYGLPLTDLRVIDRAGITRSTTHVANVSHSQRSYATSAPLIATDLGVLWEVIAAGDITPEAEADMRQSPLTPRRPRSSDEIGRAQLTRTTLIDLTDSQFGEHLAQNMFEPAPTIIWVTDPDSFIDCAWFWNMRALRSLRFAPAPMLLLPATDLRFWTGFADQLHAFLRRSEDLQPDVILRSFSVDSLGLRSIARLLKLKKLRSAPRHRRSFPEPPPREPPFTYATNIDERNYLLFHRTYGEIVDAYVEMHRTATAVRMNSPVDFVGDGGRTMLRIASSTLDGLPRRAETAEMVAQGAEWFRDELQMIAHTSARLDVTLNAPTFEAATWAVLRPVTSSAAFSDKGRLAVRLEELALSSTLLRPHALKLIRQLTTPRSKELLRELRKARRGGATNAALVELASLWGGRAERRFATAEQLTSALADGGVDTLEALVADGWAERGLSVKCERCGLRTFVAVEDTTSQPSCPSCRAPQQYEKTEHSLAISYRLNSLLDRASDQGVVPHLSAVAALRADSARSYQLPGINVTLPGGQVAEVDLFGIHDGMVIVGEAKTSASAFTESQLRRDLRIAHNLRADAYVMAAPTTLDPSSTSAAAAMAAGKAMNLITVEGAIVRRVAARP